MNLGAVDIPDPPPLPAPSPLPHYSLENPYPLAILLVVLAGVAWWSLVGRGRRQVLAAGALVLAAAGVIVLAAAVETPRERLRRDAVSVVAAVARGDAAALDAILLDTCQIERGRWGAPLTKREVVDVVARDFGPRGMYRLREAGVPRAHAAVDSPTFARVQIKVRATPEATGGPLLSWWRLDFRRDGDAWRVSGIAALTSDDAGPRGR